MDDLLQRVLDALEDCDDLRVLRKRHIAALFRIEELTEKLAESTREVDWARETIEAWQAHCEELKRKLGEVDLADQMRMAVNAAEVAVFLDDLDELPETPETER